MARKAISPIIATVLIIAVTLIAAVAIGGFVFGLLDSSQNTAQVEVVSSTWSISGKGATAILENTGTAYVETLATNAISPIYGGTSCSLDPTGSTAVSVTVGSPVSVSNAAVTMNGQNCGTTQAAEGEQYADYIILANGAQAVFTGAFIA